jgi:hypothetical protein
LIRSHRNANYRRHRFHSRLGGHPLPSFAQRFPKAPLPVLSGKRCDLTQAPGEGILMRRHVIGDRFQIVAMDVGKRLGVANGVAEDCG